MKIVKWLLPLVLVYGAFAYGQSDSVENLAGKKMPSFSMTTFAGKKITNASLKGRPYILDFWATWCGPCKAASPTMQALHKKYAGKGLVVIGANTGESSGSMALAKKYPSEHGYTYTFTSKNDELGAKLGIGGIPCFIFVDKAGKVKAVKIGFNGEASPKEFEKLVQSMI